MAKRKRRSFTADFKAQAVRIVRESGKPVGTVQRYVKGERLYTTGQPDPGMFVIISGSVALMGHSGLGRLSPIVEARPRGFHRRGRPALKPAVAGRCARG